jgi:hypothetical protein
MLRLCTYGDLAGTEQQIDCYAAMGLRTLAMGHKSINQQQLDNFMAALDSASQSIVNRTTFVRYSITVAWCRTRDKPHHLNCQTRSRIKISFL